MDHSLVNDESATSSLPSWLVNFDDDPFWEKPLEYFGHCRNNEMTTMQDDMKHLQPQQMNYSTVPSSNTGETNDLDPAQDLSDIKFVPDEILVNTFVASVAGIFLEMDSDSDETIDQLLDKIKQSHPEIEQTFYQMIRCQFDTAVDKINSYVQGMDAAFEKYRFFKEEDEFLQRSLALHKETLNYQTKLSLGYFLDATKKKMEQHELKFMQLKKEIQLQEASTDMAVEFHQGEVENYSVQLLAMQLEALIDACSKSSKSIIDSLNNVLGHFPKQYETEQNGKQDTQREELQTGLGHKSSTSNNNISNATKQEQPCLATPEKNRPKPASVTKGNMSSEPIPGFGPVAVGVHFGFKTLSAVACIDGKYRTIYGPKPNILSFASNQVLIGRCTGAIKLEMSTVLTNENIETLYYIKGSKYNLRVEELVALTLSILHGIVTNTLQTDNLCYIIAFPTCFNNIQMNAMEAALKISGVGPHSTIVRENCALVTTFLSSHIMEEGMSLWSVIEDDAKTCDSVVYSITNKKIEAIRINGDESRYSLIRCSVLVGVEAATSRVAVYYRPPIDHVILHCDSSVTNDRIRLIKENIKSKPQVHHFGGLLQFARGASVLAAFKSNQKFKDDWKLCGPEISLELILLPIKERNYYYRIMHYGKNLSDEEIQCYSEKIQKRIRQQQDAFQIEEGSGDEGEDS